MVDLINSKERIHFLDVFRGFALFYMIFFHILDYLSVESIYRDFPYYISWIQQPTLIPPPLLFMFISGISVFIFTLRRLKIKNSLDVLKELSLRYGKYLIVSFFFCYVMWGPDYFFGFEEALQGIAISAIFLGVMIVLFDKSYWEKSFIPIIVIMSLFRHYFSYYQYEFVGLFEVFYNLLIGGWFSLFNIAPLM
ncbi:MAG: heparan-alpha-glucosaminide N-acetyltransferase domain-containing protein, partial [Candidatus Woesearchaeota archaeon]